MLTEALNRLCIYTALHVQIYHMAKDESQSARFTRHIDRCKYSQSKQQNNTVDDTVHSNAHFFRKFPLIENGLDLIIIV